jgi:hypothetical protein
MAPAHPKILMRNIRHRLVDGPGRRSAIGPGVVLAFDDRSYVSGIELFVDGGLARI